MRIRIPLLTVFLSFSLSLLAPDSLIADKTLVVSLNSSQLELNPVQSFSATEAQLFSGLYEGLVTYHPFTLDPLPGVASRWTVSPDGLTYRFTLREDALYWNGDPVTAEDFRQTWLMLLDPAADAPYSFLLDGVKGARDYRTGKNSDPDSVGIRTDGPRVLEVELASPADHFLKILCHHAFSPLHPEIRESLAKGGKAPGLGNGPFFLYRQTDTELVFLRNELYWDVNKVELKEIRFLFQDDESAVADSFNQGEIHWSLGNIDFARVENKRSVVVNPLFATTYYFFAPKTAPFDDPRIRRALALLVPWNEIRSKDFYYTPAQTLIPSLEGYPEPESIREQNREEAESLLAQAGYPGGRGLPPVVLRLPRGTEETNASRIIREAWAEALDTPVEFDLLPPREYYGSLEKEGYALGILTWIGDFADPLTFLQMWASDSNLNDGGYSNPAYDELLDRAAGQTGTKRLKTLSESEGLLLGEGTVLPVSHQPALNVVDLSSLEGWYPNPLDIHPFKYMRFAVPELPPNVAEGSGVSGKDLL